MGRVVVVVLVVFVVVVSGSFRLAQRSTENRKHSIRLL